MPTAITKTIAATCVTTGATLKVSFETAEVIAELRLHLEKRLLKKGVEIQWTQATPAGSHLVFRIVEMDEGNRLLRYLIPLTGAAVLEVHGHTKIPASAPGSSGVPGAGSAPQEFHIVERAHFGLLGGSPKGMLKQCAQRVAAKIAKHVLANLEA